MASIVISFVGNQDPFGKNASEGSIVSLIKYLRQEGRAIKHVILIYTEATKTGAEDTKDWLVTELAITADKVELIPASVELSNDPTDLLRAAQEARQGLDRANLDLAEGDRIEFNASSGTPAMKSSFSILQAAGYAPQSTVWQVRNPSEMKEGQARVFPTDVGVLRQEFERKVISKQIEDFNYSGALKSLAVSSLANKQAIALLEYGRCRMAFDFNTAFNHLQSITKTAPAQLQQEINALRQRQLDAIAKELYFNAEIRYHNREFSEFLVLLTQFQECILAHLLKKELNLEVPNQRNETDSFWHSLKSSDEGIAFKNLQDFYQSKSWELTTKGFPNRSHMIGVLSGYSKLNQVMELVIFLNDYCEQRNRCVHRFEGISTIEDGDLLLTKLKKLIKTQVNLPNENSFVFLNRIILEQINALKL